MIRRLVVALASVVLAASALTGCGTTSATCVSWVAFDDAQGAFDDATLVVVGVADETAGSIELLSGPGELHRVAVEQVLKGELSADEVWAAAPRDRCVADPPQPADDPIAAGERLVLFLHPASDRPQERFPEDLGDVRAWSGLTPEWTAIPLPDGAEPPFDTGG